eukprot:evm.model.scf_1350.5 EVM.evm.TU.scf_1350.5   scf_1350:31812-32357(-)
MAQGDGAQDAGNSPSHPVARFFHLVFKIVALVWLPLVQLSPYGFTGNFVGLLILLCADFWVVKNVTGRLLVGLRWWNDVSEDGQEDGWRFESLQEGQRGVNGTDKIVFWAGLVGNVVLWTLYGLYVVISLKWKWLLVVAMALLLGAANLWGYFRCSREAKKAVSDFAQNAMNTTLQAALKV